ncbi:MAG: cytidylate kinase-like family protein [Muribaculaceae bacterium]|nr:cytidylate kinase-like family protein [Muribaculaceae bacterium]
MENDTNKRSFVITISRQFGCGAREIGLIVSRELGIPYYDKELLLEAAKSSGVKTEVFEAADERTPSFFSGLWSFNIGYNSGVHYVGNTPQSDDGIYRAQSDVMIEIARRGPCVIVGRTADYILRSHTEVISIFIHASLEDRVRRMIARGDCKTEKEAEKMTEKKNRERADYYNFYTGKNWGDAASYDLSVDESKLGVEGTAQVILAYIRSRLHSPE